MNKNGWYVKQIEGVQFGKYGKYSGQSAGYGYGFSFTEVLLVLWEKEIDIRE